MGEYVVQNFLTVQQNTFSLGLFFSLDAWFDRRPGTQTVRQADKQPNGQTVRQEGRQTEKQRDKQRDRQTGKQTDPTTFSWKYRLDQEKKKKRNLCHLNNLKEIPQLPSRYILQNIFRSAKIQHLLKDLQPEASVIKG